MSFRTVVGARILVPLGRNLVTGYIVALHGQLEANSNLAEADIKEAESLLDTATAPIPNHMAGGIDSHGKAVADLNAFGKD